MARFETLKMWRLYIGELNEKQLDTILEILYDKGYHWFGYTRYKGDYFIKVDAKYINCGYKDPKDPKRLSHSQFVYEPDHLELLSFEDFITKITDITIITL